MNYILGNNKQLFYINSRLRTDLINDTDSSFTFRFDGIDHNKEFDSVVLMDASIPKSAYTVGSTNNTFTVTEEIDGGPATNRTITLPVGNYTRNSLKKVLKEKLNDNPSTYVYDITYQNINLTNDNGKFTFTWTNINGTAQEPSFIFTDSLWEQTGFNKNSTNVFVSGSLESANVVNLRPEGTYYILSDITQNQNNNILQNIITNGYNDFNYVTFQNNNISEYSKIYVQNNSNAYRFTVVDENFHQIELNGINVVMTLMLYKRNDISNLIKGYIKYKTLLDEEK
eukprot:Lithocolla_globosa_v1_NODE_15_length_10543_cov_26.361651.p3 type:complete len:284 gc:universal NODE_15_length_10543_cov_26.361651:9529-10380(+)